MKTRITSIIITIATCLVLAHTTPRALAGGVICNPVTSTADDGSPGTLRYALACANPGETITFDTNGVFATPQTIVLTNGELLVTNSVTIFGPGPTNLAIDGNASSLVFHVGSNSVVTIASLTITNGPSSGSAGGIYNDNSTLTVSNCTISGNLGFLGGGILNWAQSNGVATLEIVNSTISNNAGLVGGGILNFAGSNSVATVHVINSTLSGNLSQGGGGIGNFGSGSATVTIVNSTLSGNGGSVGGIYNFGADSGSATATIVNSTLSGNEGISPIGIFNESDSGVATVEISSTILNASSSGTNIVNNAGTITSLGYNLSSDDASAFLTDPTDQNSTNPLLGPLQDNGGPTFTHAPLCGSPAIDKGTNFTGSATDQRGASRTFDDPNIPSATGGDGTDIGAVESPVFVFTVLNTNDSGAGSLRAAISNANVSAGTDLIDFDSSAYGTITLTSGQLLITDCLFIDGPGATNVIVDGGFPATTNRVFQVGSGIDVTIAGLTITNGNSTGLGGGIYNGGSTLTVSNCTVTGNSAQRGGGIYNDASTDSATLTILNTTLSGNSASASGGGLYNFVFQVTNIASMTMIASTLSGNSATFDAGGIYNDCFFSGNATLTILNSTLSGNSAGRVGGGIFNHEGRNSATLNIGSTILDASPIFNIGGTVTSLGYNLSSDGAGGFLNQPTDQTNTPPLLGSLQLNGGQTPTHALSCGSPAIDAGTNFLGLATDQRGFQRTFGAATDIGAFELQQFCSLATTTTVDSASVQYSDMVKLHASVSPVAATGSVQFKTNGVAVGSPVTVSGGAATLDYTIVLPAGSNTITAAFTSSDAGFSDSSGDNTLTVTREDANVVPDLNNPYAVKVNAPGGTALSIVLKASITELQNGSAQVTGTTDTLGDICNATPVSVTLTPLIGSGNLTVSAAALVSCDGTNRTVQAAFNNVPVNVYQVSFSIGGKYYIGTANSVLAVYDPSSGFVTGGGAVLHNGVRANFVFSAKYLKKGQTQGSLLYIEHRATSDVVLKSNSMGALAIVGSTAAITGKATLNGVGNYGFQATVMDKSDPGSSDQFGLKVTNPAGAVVNDLTFAPVTLTGGNVVVPH